MNWKAQYGPWAFVAGASEGIGAAFSHQLAALGINLILASRSRPKLESLETELRKRFSIATRILSLDLTDPEFFARAERACRGREVGLLVYNAGAVHGAAEFLDQPVDAALDLVSLNCDGPIRLAHHFGQGMKRRRAGGMIFLSSMAALAGGSYIATYAATKAFDILFAQSLWHELAPYNIQVLALIAGATRTPAMLSSGLDFADDRHSGLSPMEAEDVAAEGLANLANGPVWVAGEANRKAAAAISSLERREAVEGMSSATAAMYNKVYQPVRG